MALRLRRQTPYEEGCACKLKLTHARCCHAQNYSEGVSYANVPYPKQMLAALANIDVDFPGSCGRCYEVSLLHAQAGTLMLR